MWSRTRNGVYLPAIELGDQGLIEFLDHHGWDVKLGKSDERGPDNGDGSSSAYKNRCRVRFEENSENSSTESTPSRVTHWWQLRRCETVLAIASAARPLRLRPAGEWRAAIGAGAALVLLANLAAAAVTTQSGTNRRCRAGASDGKSKSLGIQQSQGAHPVEKHGSSSGEREGSVGSLRKRTRPRMELSYED